MHFIFVEVCTDLNFLYIVYKCDHEYVIINHC